MMLPEFDPPFRIVEPLHRSVPFLVNVPHAGDIYPASFLMSSKLDALTLRRSEDAFVDDLFSSVPGLGAPLMMARFPRAYLDVNREPHELDPRLVEGRLPAYANSRSPRVSAGLGVIPRIVADGQEIYAGKLPLAEALSRIETLHKPYHQALRTLVKETQTRFGHAILIDGHSMPSNSQGRGGADIVLGDRYNASCAPFIMDCTERAFREAGFRCARNRPYAGGFITETYGQPGQGSHALQIEICRGLYMDEKRLERRSGFEAVKMTLTSILARIISQVTQSLNASRMAAE